VHNSTKIVRTQGEKKKQQNEKADAESHAEGAKPTSSHEKKEGGKHINDRYPKEGVPKKKKKPPRSDRTSSAKRRNLREGD